MSYPGRQPIRSKYGNRIVEDFKGFRTDVYKIKKRMMKWLYDIDIRETSDKDLGKKVRL